MARSDRIRALARLVALCAVAGIAACTPRLPLEKLRCPCLADEGFVCCQTEQICYLAAALPPTCTLAGVMNAGATAARRLTRTLRQTAAATAARRLTRTLRQTAAARRLTRTLRQTAAVMAARRLTRTLRQTAAVMATGTAATPGREAPLAATRAPADRVAHPHPTSGPR
jgi:hypothetical protein